MDLTLVSLEEIITELEKRFDAFIFANVKTLDSGRENVGGYYWGGKPTCLGLAEHLKFEILGDMHEIPESEDD